MEYSSSSSLPLCFMDSEQLLQCPYDKNHQIRPCRFPYHLVKCRENNKKIAKELATCPYNARHRVPRQELSLHMSSCENKVSQELERAAYGSTNRAREVIAFQCPPSQEDWEADVDESPAPPFVFGTSHLSQGNQNTSCSFYKGSEGGSTRSDNSLNLFKNLNGFK